MTELNALMFEVVRRGYDIDEVNDHLATIERQRGAELDRAQAAIQQKDAEIGRLHELTAEVEVVGTRRAEVDRMTVEAAQKRESMLEEASRAAREQTTLASKTAASLRAETEKEMSALRRDTESELSELRATTRQELDAKLSDAQAEAKRIELDAQEKAQRLETETLKRLAEFEAGQELELQHRRSQADRDHSAALRSHRQIEEQLALQITRLQEMRDSLVGTMTAIAHGGLAALEGSAVVESVEPVGHAEQAAPPVDTTESEAPESEATESEAPDTDAQEAAELEMGDSPGTVEAASEETDAVEPLEPTEATEAAESAEFTDTTEPEHPQDGDLEGSAPYDGNGSVDLEVEAAMAADTVELNAADVAAASAAVATSKWRLISAP